jgi:hypothetical protein
MLTLQAWPRQRLQLRRWQQQALGGVACHTCPGHLAAVAQQVEGMASEVQAQLHHKLMVTP